jgi:hypothetical protein
MTAPLRATSAPRQPGTPLAPGEDQDKYRLIDGENRYLIRTADGFAALVPQNVSLVTLSPEERAQAAADPPLWNKQAGRPIGPPPPATSDPKWQTPLKDQRDRETCVAFASIACLEALLKRQSKGVDLILSEQYTNWMFMNQEHQSQCAEVLPISRAARYLTEQAVCAQSFWTYTDRAHINCLQPPPMAAERHAVYLFAGSVQLIDRLPDATGPSIHNTSYLESLLSQGRDIVFSTGVAWWQPDASGVFCVRLQPDNTPEPVRGYHAMLLVGYDRNHGFFLAKNSWTDQYTRVGYMKLSYDYIETYAQPGYVVTGARQLPAPFALAKLVGRLIARASAVIALLRR